MSSIVRLNNYDSSRFKIVGITKYVSKISTFLISDIEEISFSSLFFFYTFSLQINHLNPHNYQFHLNFPPFQQSIYAIYKAIRRKYGAIELEHSGCKCIHVRIGGTEAAELIKRQPRMVIDGRTMTLQFYGFDRRDKVSKQIMPISDSLKPPSSAKDNILGVLNDDCLYAIIKHSHLNLEDMLALSNTCKSLNALSMDVLRGNSIQNKLYNDFEQLLDDSNRIGFVDDYLKNFGHSIQIVRASTSTFRNQVHLHMVAEHCKNIEYLTIEMDDHRFPHQWTTFKALFQNNEHIEHLAIIRKFSWEYYDMEFPDVKLKQLRCMHLVSVYVAGTKSFTKFCQANSHVQQLWLTHIDLNPTALVSLIHLTNVRALYMHMIHENGAHFLHIFQMAGFSLQSVVVSGPIGWLDQIKLFDVVKKFTDLRRFEHVNPRYEIRIDLLIDAVNRLDRLKKIQLEAYYIQFEDILELLQEASQVQVFVIVTYVDCEYLTSQMDTIDEIHEFVSQGYGIQLNVDARVYDLEPWVLEVSYI